MVHQQADPRREPLGAFSDTSSFDPMERIAVQGRMLRDAKARLHDPASWRRSRWAAGLLLLPVVGPIVGGFAVFLVVEVVGLLR
jgi:hypothetical protein